MDTYTVVELTVISVTSLLTSYNHPCFLRSVLHIVHQSQLLTKVWYSFDTMLVATAMAGTDVLNDYLHQLKTQDHHVLFSEV